ncbi:MAG: ABC transporter permease [Phycisphaerales bacterium]|nr:MAG: ABC transporter permease [Phycisphaerales bacterium]
MSRRLLTRLGLGMATLICVYVVTFLLVISAPGNPFEGAERNMPPEVVRALKARYSMDSELKYFFQFLWGAIRLDFGPSFQYHDWTCSQIIADALPVSAALGFLAVGLAVLVGVPVGVLSAVKPNGWFDVTSLGFVLLGISLPTFVTGSALLIVFAVWLKVAPVGGWGRIAHLPLPALTLSLPFAAYVARLTRAGMLDVLGSEFIRTALAKGLAPRTVVWKHAFKVAFLPVLSFLGPAAAQAMTGSFVVEKVFSIPGMGQHFVNGALNLNRGLVMSTVLAYATILIVFNIVVDILYTFVDPRIKEAT